MAQSDDKPRGINAREASRLRAILGSEPSSGYAFHDASRVERVRTGRPAERGQPGSQAPQEEAFQQALAGVNMHELQPEDGEAATANDQGQGIGTPSWPPMPQVPTDLVGVMEAEPAGNAASRPPRAPSARPVPQASSTPPVGVAGGAIWQALPSVVGAPEPDAPAEAPPEAAEDAAPAEAIATRNPSLRNSRPAAYRGSMAELELEAPVYGDPRVRKYEAMVERGAWEQLQSELGRERELSPVLELLHIIARRETLKSEERNNAALLSQEAIGVFARLLGLPERSPTALLIGKRLLRKNPGWSRTRTPSTGLSAGMLLAGIAVGAGIGWLVTRLIL